MSDVSIGLGTIMGYAAAVAAALAPVIGQLADATEPLGVPPATWVVVSALLTAVTTIGRQWQAANKADAPAVPANVEIDGIPVNPHEGAER